MNRFIELTEDHTGTSMLINKDYIEYVNTAYEKDKKKGRERVTFVVTDRGKIYVREKYEDVKKLLSVRRDAFAELN